MNPANVGDFLWECPFSGRSAKFGWEFKQGFVMTDISIAVHLQEFPLRELPLYL